jgi:hypothetical protein
MSVIFCPVLLDFINIFRQIPFQTAFFERPSGQIISANASSKLELTLKGTLDEQEKKELKAKPFKRHRQSI